MTLFIDSSKGIASSSRHIRGRSAIASAALMLAAVTGAIGVTAASGATTGPVAHLDASSTSQPAGRSNPGSSVAPSRNFQRYCYTPGYKVQCNTAAIFDIDKGRHAEHVPNIAIPNSYWLLTAPQKLSFLANKERAVRGFATLATSHTLDNQAQVGAVKGDDPSGPSNYAWGSNIAWGYQTPLAADFGWMYDDGPGSPNIACGHASSSGCWGHRDNILANWTGAQGAGEYDDRGTVQLTQLFVAGY